MISAVSITIKLLLSASRLAPADSFSAAEKSEILNYWNQPGRYSVSLPADSNKVGVFQVRLTTEGSLWLQKYQRALGANRLPPTQDAAADSGSKDWEKWVSVKVEYDRYLAGVRADMLNNKSSFTSPAPSFPGPAPETLVAAVGNPPSFANVVAPMVHDIAFDQNEIYHMPDNIAMRPKYAYYRFSQGTMVLGQMLKDMPAAELNGLFAEAGFNESEQRIARAVSILEGGFESVNTYDTGYVSVGFIQSACLEAGRGSLGETLLSEKKASPEAFARDFRKYGLNITDDGTIVVLDLQTGVELTGKPAAAKIIDDKRFAAVFQKAGRQSKEFRLAQIRIARDHYWPTNDALSIKLGDNSITCKVSDVIKSEAGIATLYDRKVNRGTLAPISDVIAKVMAAHNLTQISEVGPFEREIIVQMKYRTNFLNDTTLSQPK